MRMTLLRATALMVALTAAIPASAQFGHPLKGTWSGDWGNSNSNRSRLLLELNWDGDATSIWLSYETTYELGIATEQFVWVLDGEKTRLDGYQIDSKELILR